LFTSVFAANVHLHPKANSTVDGKAPTKSLMSPGSCEIEIINSSSVGVNVFGEFDDGMRLEPFSIYPSPIGYDSPHYISLYYYGDCHRWMSVLSIETFAGYNVFTGYDVPVRSTIRVLPYLNKLKVEISNK